MQTLRSRICEFIEGLKGEALTEQIYTHQDPMEGYTVVTNSGQRIELFCREQCYAVRYEAWWARTRVKRIYHVYARCSNDTPEHLLELLQRDLYTPALLPGACSRLKQKKAAIDCYLQWLLTLKQSQSFKKKS